MEVGRYVNAYRSKKMSTFFKGRRQVVEITPNKTSAKSGDTINVELPAPKDLLIVPGSLALTFDLDIVLDPSEPGNTVNNYPVNNLAGNIYSHVVVKIDSDPIFYLNNAHLYYTYKDLWLTGEKRSNSVYKGIQEEELRKLRADLNTKLPDVKGFHRTLKDVYGKKYIVPINFDLITEHIPLPACEIVQTINFELVVNEVKYVLNYSKETADFTLKNIRVVYTALSENELYKQIVQNISIGFAFLYDHIHHYDEQEISKKETSLSVNITADRKSLKGILLIFQDDFNLGERDSERFPNPEIENISFQIDDLPNQLFEKGMKQCHHFDEICKHFVTEEFKEGYDIYMNLQRYYADNKYALWIDLRSTEDNLLHGTGKSMNKDEKGKKEVKMTIKKKNKGIDGKYTMHTYLISDARIKIKNKKFEKHEY